jgi:hypothetical protein
MKRREFISLLGGVAASPRISDNIHGGGSVCHQTHSDTEVGIYAHCDAAVSIHDRSVLSADGAALTYACAG